LERSFSFPSESNDNYPENYLTMIKSYIKIAFRNLLRKKGYSLINIGGLAIGMTVTFLIGLWIVDELSFNKYHENYGSIAQVYRKETRGGETEVSNPQVTGLGTLLKTEYGTHFKEVVMVRNRTEDRVIEFEEKKFTQAGFFMQPNGPEMLTLKMTAGVRSGLKEMKSILLSASLAKKLFGNSDPINQIVLMDANSALTVTGVYEDLPRNSDFAEATYFAPLDLLLEGASPDVLNSWDNYFINIYVQLNPTASPEKISTLIKNATHPYVDEKTIQAKQEIFLHPMSEWHLNSEFENGSLIRSKKMMSVWYFGIIGIFVLLLACINFMNLSTARSESRAKEVGIRKSIGSNRFQLIQQFYGESFLVAIMAFVLSIVLMQLILPWFNSVADKKILIPWTSSDFWLIGAGFIIVSGTLAGSYPALYLSSFKPVKVLKGTFKAGSLAALPRKALVVIQFTVSIALVIGTITVYEQIQFVKKRPIGYSRNGLIQLRSTQKEFAGKYNTLREQLKGTGMVEEIAEANYSITDTRGWNNGFSWQGQEYEPSFNTIFVTVDYGNTIGWEFVEGRDFSRDIPSDSNGVVINESALKILNIKNSVGEELRWGNRGTYKILGVVKDIVKGSPYEPTSPSIVFLSKFDLRWLYIRMTPNANPHQALPKIGEVLNRLIPSAPFEYTFADENFAAKFSAEERIGKLATFVSALAILISCLGLFGLASFVSEQRTKEIGIRKVLGATVINLWQMLSKDFVVLIIISCSIAIPLSYSLMTDWLQNYQYRTEISVWVFVTASVGAVLITLLTISFQTIKAAITNPVESLRSE
jgi:ABC-type antimicrobial peptide transport system permease subunit